MIEKMQKRSPVWKFGFIKYINLLSSFTNCCKKQKSVRIKNIVEISFYFEVINLGNRTGEGKSSKKDMFKKISGFLSFS